MIRRILVAIGAAFVAVVLMGGAASALPAPHTSGNRTPAAATASGPNVTCVKASVTFTHPTLGTFESSTSGEPCTVQLSSWSVPDTYNGKGAADPSSKPQALFDRVTATLTGEGSTVTVMLPPSRWCQIDYRAAGGTYLYGHIVECHPTPKPTPSITVTPKPPVVNCAAGQHKSHGKCVTDGKPSTSSTPAPSPTALAFTGASVREPLLIAGSLVGLGGLVLLPLPWARFTRLARRRH